MQSLRVLPGIHLYSLPFPSSSYIHNTMSLATLCKDASGGATLMLVKDRLISD